MMKTQWVAVLCLLCAGVMQSETAQGLEVLYISGYGQGTLSTINSSGIESLVQSGFVNPEGLAFDGAGDLYLISGHGPNGAQTISKITPDGHATTFASGIFGNDLAFDKNGNLYVTTVSSVVKITPAGVATTFVSGLSGASGLAFDKSGNLYVANFDGGSVSEVTPSGIVSTFATGFNTPVGLAFDNKGDLFVSDANAHSITEITPGGVRSTIYSIPAINGDLPDGNIFDPRGMAFDKNGDLFVSVFSDLALFEFDEDGGFRRFAISSTANWIAFGPSAVPEPSTWAMMLIGFVGIGLFGWQRTRYEPRG